MIELMGTPTEISHCNNRNLNAIPKTILTLQLPKSLGHVQINRLLLNQLE